MSEQKRIRVDDDQMHEDLNYLSTTDVDSALKKVEELRRKYMMDRAEATAYLSLTEGTVPERKARAKKEKVYLDAEDKYLAAFEASEVLKAKRYSAALRVDVWRSMNANRRAGGM